MCRFENAAWYGTFCFACPIVCLGEHSPHIKLQPPREVGWASWDYTSLAVRGKHQKAVLQRFFCLGCPLKVLTNLNFDYRSLFRVLQKMLWALTSFADIPEDMNGQVLRWPMSDASTKLIGNPHQYKNPHFPWAHTTPLLPPPGITRPALESLAWVGRGAKWIAKTMNINLTVVCAHAMLEQGSGLYPLDTDGRYENTVTVAIRYRSIEWWNILRTVWHHKWIVSTKIRKRVNYYDILNSSKLSFLRGIIFSLYLFSFSFRFFIFEHANIFNVNVEQQYWSFVRGGFCRLPKSHNNECPVPHFFSFAWLAINLSGEVPSI